MRDLILKPESKALPTIYYHILCWCLFISYEIFLSAAFRGSFNRFSDYFLHYLLYVVLFYVHCYFTFKDLSLDKLSDYGRLLTYLLMELACFYVCNALINNYLIASGSRINVIETSSRLFHLGTFYRFIYIIGFSTAFRIGLNLLKTQKRNLEFVTKTLTQERINESLQTKLLSAKLAILRSQVNPHFLFNTLNSLYNRFRKKDPENAEYIMTLAEMMQYAIQPETAEDEFPVEFELDHISNYLKLQKMRYSIKIDVISKVEEPDLRIAHLLLINIVENVFTHGDLENPECTPLIEIVVSEGELQLRTKNYIRRNRLRGNGMGLINIRERLEHQYKDRFEFEYGAEGNIFNVKLRVKLR